MSIHDDIRSLAERIVQTDDWERDHGVADDVLINCIRSLALWIDDMVSNDDSDGAWIGFGDVTEITDMLISKYEALHKWYA